MNTNNDKFSCPFVVGQRLMDKNLHKIVVVTDITSEGFSWELEDGPLWLGTRIGWYKNGTCFQNGFSCYEAISNE